MLPETEKEEANILLSDVRGKVVKNISLTINSASEPKISIEIGSLPTGIYYVTFQSSEYTLSGRFVKM
jgi:D-alanyl-lipoteichoic acid acyltransferase DltB (MBOAT superfamily)